MASVSNSIRKHPKKNLSCAFREPEPNRYWFTLLSDSPGNKYVLNEHVAADEYVPYTIPSKVILCYSYPSSLVSLFDNYSYDNGDGKRWTEAQTCVRNTTLRLGDQGLKVACLLICFEQLMMTSSNGNIFRVTGPLCGEFTSHQWIPRTRHCNVSANTNSTILFIIMGCFLFYCTRWFNENRTNDSPINDRKLISYFIEIWSSCTITSNHNNNIVF